MQKILGLSLGIIILFFLFYFQYTQRKPLVKNIIKNELVDSKMLLKNMKPLSNKYCLPDSSDIRIIVFASAECSQCENLIKILDKIKKEDRIRKDLIVVIPSFQEVTALEKYWRVNFPIYLIQPDEVTSKIKYVPTFLLVDENKTILDVVQGGVITKEDLDFILKDFLITNGYKHSTRFEDIKNWATVTPQSNPFSCGASALSMIFAARRINVPLDTIEKSVVKPFKGSTMLDLKEYAQRKGLISRGWTLSFEHLKKIKMPAIICVENNSHFVVLDSIKLDSAYIRDPLRGITVIPKKKFLQLWDGNALEFL